jgi:lipopolysaccharide transport system ATP-binding protein
MSDSVVKVENLSKRYILSHQPGHGGSIHRYRRFSDVLINAVRAPFRRWEKADEPDSTHEEFWALKDVSFTINRGEVVGVIGRNGAGKSTLLKILSRITEPTHGRIEIEGRVASLLEVGTGFHPELTGRENVYLNGAILGMTREEIGRKFGEIVAFAEVEKFLDTPVKHYSSGMYVRLAFAVAAHLEPEILVVDEVLAVGDFQFQKKCLGKMESVAEKEGRTVIFVSHNVAAVRQLCRNVIVLDKGRVVFQGPTEEGLRHYLEASGAEEEKPSLVLEPPPNDRLPLTLKRATLIGDSGGDAPFYLNQPLTVKVEFTSKEPTRELVVGMVIYDAQGLPILNANNVYQPYAPFAEPVTAGQVICELGIVPWMPGRYSISFWVGLTEDNLQVIEHGLTFTVLTRDAWGTGRLPPQKVSPLWWPTKFTLGPGSSD